MIGALVVRGLPKVRFLVLFATDESAIFRLTAGPHPIKLDDGYLSLKTSRTELPTGSTWMSEIEQEIYKR